MSRDIDSGKKSLSDEEKRYLIQRGRWEGDPREARRLLGSDAIEGRDPGSDALDTGQQVAPAAVSTRGGEGPTDQELEAMDYRQLKDLAKARDLNAGGSREELIERLKA